MKNITQLQIADCVDRLKFKTSADMGTSHSNVLLLFPSLMDNCFWDTSAIKYKLVLEVVGLSY